jgi:diguanylate cyclase (GGDEF)-like protein/PAS domain S-box-containing protein
MFDSNRLLTNPASPPALVSGNRADLSRMSELDVGGRRWNLYFDGRQAFVNASDRWLPWIAFVGGVTITLLLFGLIRSLAAASARAVALAASITRDLRHSEVSLAAAQRMTQELIEVLPNPIFFKGTDGRYLGVNRAWEKFFGVTRQSFIGKTVYDLYPDRRDIADRLHAMDQVLWNRPGTQSYETSITTPDEQRHDTIYYKATFTGADGSVAGLIGTIFDITERKYAETARARLAAIVENSNDAIISRMLDGTILSWNAGAEKMLGYTAAEAIGQSIALTLPPDRPPNQARNNEIVLRGEVVVRESDRMTKDRRLIDVLTSHSPIRDSAGNIVGSSVILQDITALKQAQTAVKESEERFRATFDQAAVGIVHTSLDGRYSKVNQKFCDMLGYGESELLGRLVTDFTHPDDRETGRQYRQLMLERKLDKFSEEKRYLRKDGSVIWTNRTVSLARDAAGEPMYFIRVIEDITDRKEAEERYRATFDNAPVGIMHTAVEGYGILRANRKLCEMLGYTHDELLDMTSTELVHPDYRFTDEAKYRTQLMKDEVPAFSSERKYLRKDGSSIWVNRTVSLVHDAAGKPLYFIRIIEDITERREAEKALRDSETRYRSVIAVMAEGVFVRDNKGRIVTCNASAERIIGRSLEQMRGSLYFDPSWEAIREDGSAFPDDERPVNVVLRSRAAQSNVTMGLRKADGTVLWLVTNAQPLFEGPDTAPGGVVTTITDVTQRKQAALRQMMEHRVTRLLSEAESLEESIPGILQTICETLGCACGACWLWDENKQKRVCAESWGVQSAEIAEFLALNLKPRQLPRAAGGLLNRVWSDGEPVWIADITKDATFRRAPIAIKAGLHGAFAFPLRFGDDILGVMEFFSRYSRPADDVLLLSARSIGSQIGQFLARRKAEERVSHLAHFDELTGLSNRSTFNQRLQHAIAQAQRHAKPLAVLFIDLDRFKIINDTLGHDAGDRVLREVAQRFGACLRESDTVARLGGDEFVVLIEELPDLMHVTAVAQKILAAVAETFVVEAQEFRITASIGISTYPDDSEDMPTLLKNADIAMYRAKEQGKNNYQFYSAQMNVHSVERLTLESSLRRAVERNEFLLHYQPKIDMGSGRITGVEALVRWQLPAKALVSPAQFIPLAEETGLIVPIGEWVLKTACARNKAWQDNGMPALRMAVNLSPRQFVHEKLLHDVARVLEETGLDPTTLEFEITESMVMHNPEHAVKLLNELKAMGIHLSIDDFGTGYSSLSHLKRFPIDSVKIDRSFIRDIPGDADDAAITQAIIAMAHGLRLTVIAEGVETTEQVRFLRDHGCDEIQGYYFSKPLPEVEFLRLVQDCVAPSAAFALR